MNRGSDLGVRLAGRLAIASMRPRFMNRGSPARPAAAQGGHRRFNEAPIHESGKSARRSQDRRSSSQLQ